MAGSQVMQLYTHFKSAHVPRPSKQLSAFKRGDLAHGEAVTLKFTVDCAQLGYYNEDMEFVVEPAFMDVMLGTSAHDLPFVQQVELTGSTNPVMGRRSYSATAQLH